MPATVEPPFLVALNLTRRCNLHCAHCYLDAGTKLRGAPAELDTNELKVLLKQIAALSTETMVVLSGGEPLLRPDLFAIARHACELGLMTVVGTNGTLLDERRVAELCAAGVAAVGISLDSLHPAHHDRFRGRAGAWAATMAGIDRCRQAGLAFQIHFSATDDNADELEAMIEFTRTAGAVALNVFFLVCTGRGEKVSNISPETYDRVLERLTRAARDETELLVRAKCAPHFKRVAFELDPGWPITLAHGYEAGGCLAGRRYCRVSPEGELTPCPYIEASAGSVRERNFAELWRDSPLFAELRAPRLKGRCGACEYAKLCGGCRARPLAREGELWGEDFLCLYRPKGGPVIEPQPETEARMAWTAEAEARLRRVPAPVRRFVRRRAEDYGRRLGASVITGEHLQALARRRFGGGPPHPAVPPAAPPGPGKSASERHRR